MPRALLNSTRKPEMQHFESTDLTTHDGRTASSVMVVDWDVAAVQGIGILSIPRLSIDGGDEERTFMLSMDAEGGYVLSCAGLPTITLEPGFTKAAADLLSAPTIQDRIVHEFDNIQSLLDLDKGRMSRLTIDMAM